MLTKQRHQVDRRVYHVQHAVEGAVIFVYLQHAHSFFFSSTQSKRWPYCKGFSLEGKTKISRLQTRMERKKEKKKKKRNSDKDRECLFDLNHRFDTMRSDNDYGLLMAGGLQNGSAFVQLWCESRGEIDLQTRLSKLI